MSSLSIVSLQGYMPISAAIATAYADSATLTMQLAATASPLQPAVLAAAEPMSGLVRSSAGTLPGRGEDALLEQLIAAANNACYRDKDPAACSAASQTLAAYQAGATCANSTATVALHAKRDRGSIQDWFRAPTEVTTIKPTSNEIAAAAISLAAVRAYQ
jgi:hypothetical protein